METHVDFEAICGLFERAEAEGRDYLYEYEVYDLIRYSGSETPPAYLFLKKSARLGKEELKRFPGDRVVVKIVSPYILHKSDIGGVQIVEKSLESILSTIRRMYYDIPRTFRDAIRYGKFDLPLELEGLADSAIEQEVTASFRGVVVCQYMHPDSQEFGNELLVSLRCTREFGMILSAGLGGTDTELYAKRFRKGQAVVAASTAMVDGDDFFSLFQTTISYKKLAGLTRGQKRIVTDEQLLECFSALIEVGNYFSPLNPNAPFVLEEVEINPFAFSDYLMLPLDGLCRFTGAARLQQKPNTESIDRLLHPRSIGVVGASSKGKNIGRIIVENITKMGFSTANLVLVHPSAKGIDGIGTVPGLAALPNKVDLLILAVNGEAIPGLVEQVVRYDLAHGIILVPGGVGDDESQEASGRMLEQIEQVRAQSGNGPVLLGGNSLGILSHPGGYDALFIPESKLPKIKGRHVRKSALVSQSGAYMITRMSRLSFLDPAYAISIGNQIDLSAGDFLHYFTERDELETIAFYMEGFKDFDGILFSQAVRKAQSRGKEIIFYKAGRTEEGKTALSGHTASIAGDYMVCESCIDQAGAFVAETFVEFEGLLRLSRTWYHKVIAGNRLAALSNAGYEAVGIADNIMGEDYSLQLSRFSDSTVTAMDQVLNAAGLNSLVTIANPMDVTPMATEDVYASLIEHLLKDENVDVVVVAIVPLTPLLHTLPEEDIGEDPLTDSHDIVKRITVLHENSEKPLVMVVDSGPLYDHLATALEQGGLPVFRSADQAVRVVGKYVRSRLVHKGR